MPWGWCCHWHWLTQSMAFCLCQPSYVRPPQKKIMLRSAATTSFLDDASDGRSNNYYCSFSWRQLGEGERQQMWMWRFWHETIHTRGWHQAEAGSLPLSSMAVRQSRQYLLLFSLWAKNIGFCFLVNTTTSILIESLENAAITITIR